MGWIDKNGKRLNKTDCECIRTLYKDVFDGIFEEMAMSQKYRDNQADYKALIQQLKAAADEMLQQFDKKGSSKKLICVDSFFDKGMRRLVDMAESQKEKFGVLDMNAIRKSLASVYGRSGIKGYKPEKQDTAKGLKESMGSFKLTKKAFKGIENIKTYAADGSDFAPLTELRKGNSETFELAGDDETLKRKYQDALDCSYEASDVFKKKNKVSFSDLYNAFSRFNSYIAEEFMYVRPGKLSASAMKSGEVDGVSPMSMPVQLYYFLDNVAEKINSIKKVKNKDLQKSQAVQLAAFTYQMAIAEHVFGDGNGRTSRLLSDTILQTFDMPPHTPNPAIMGLISTVGYAMDYDKGAAIMLQGVKVSNDYLELNKGNTREGIADEAKRILDEEKINTGIVDEKNPKSAVELAIRVRENKNALLEACDDLIKANHFGSKNSEQYKALVSQTKALKQLLKTKPMNSEDVAKQMEQVDEASVAYVEYTKTRERTDVTRRARLSAARRLSSLAVKSGKLSKAIQKKLAQVESAGNAPEPQKKTGRSL